MRTVAITGDGSVASSPAGIACPIDCTEDYDQGTVVTLAPFPGAGSGFASWGGACSGSGVCTVTMSAASAVTATFAQRTAPAAETARTRPPPIPMGSLEYRTMLLLEGTDVPGPGKKAKKLTVRGTLWRTDDFCDSTLVAVKLGVVDVFDQVTRKHVSVRAGRSYLARA